MSKKKKSTFCILDIDRNTGEINVNYKDNLQEVWKENIISHKDYNRIGRQRSVTNFFDNINKRNSCLFNFPNSKIILVFKVNSPLKFPQKLKLPQEVVNFLK